MANQSEPGTEASVEALQQRASAALKAGRLGDALARDEEVPEVGVAVSLGWVAPRLLARPILLPLPNRHRLLSRLSAVFSRRSWCYLDSIAPYRRGAGYAIPGEFVIAAGHLGSTA